MTELIHFQPHSGKEEHKFNTSLNYIVRPTQNKQTAAYRISLGVHITKVTSNAEVCGGTSIVFSRMGHITLVLYAAKQLSKQKAQMVKTISPQAAVQKKRGGGTNGVDYNSIQRLPENLQ